MTERISNLTTAAASAAHHAEEETLQWLERVSQPPGTRQRIALAARQEEQRHLEQQRQWEQEVRMRRASELADYTPKGSLVLPNGPCVYYLWAPTEQREKPLYVGKTKNLAGRLGSHSTTQPWWPEVCRITWALCQTEDDALILEAYEIARLHPLHNIVRPWQYPDRDLESA